MPEPVEVLQQQAEEAGLEVVDIPEVPAEPMSQTGEDSPADAGFALMVPNKAEPYSFHDTIDDWIVSYTDLQEKTARAGKRPHRERMTAIRELKEANESLINKIDIGKRTELIANYSKRIRALGAAQR